MSNGSTTWTYTYNTDGLRIGRTDGINTYTYVYNGSQLRQMKKGNDVLFFTYDADGRPMSVTHQYITNGYVQTVDTYYYVTNLQGDVIAILDSIGQKAVEYVYDAWGRICSPVDYSQLAGIAWLNPLRYRGYVYDRETGLYYLQSRYYNPTWGRFINADDTAYLGADGTLLSYNLFAYCGNNPVMYADPTGHSATLALILGITAMVGFGLTIAGVATDNNILTAVGLTMVAAPALISGGMAISLMTPVGMGVGLTTGVAGLGTGLFASAEYQEAFTGNNWMLDTGMSEGWYNGLMLTTAGIATLGTVASGFVHSFNINSIQSIGRFGKYGESGYPGIKFTTAAGKTRVLTFHTHSHVLGKGMSQWHWQLQKWNPLVNEAAGTIHKWLWWNLRRF